MADYDIADMRALFAFLLAETRLLERVDALERHRGVEAWEDGPRRNPAPVMGARGERRPVPYADCQDEPACDPTGTDPMPVVAAAETGFAVYTGEGRWKP